MLIPKLSPSSRSREFNSYTEDQKKSVVFAWLFEEMSHRDIDKYVLHLDSDYSRGYQSMGILHYLGLKKEFHGIFKGLSVQDAICYLADTGDSQYNPIINILSGIEDSFDMEIQNDIKAETEEVDEVHREGQPTQYYTTRYERDPRNRMEAIEIHGTKCMACGFDFEKFYGERGKNYIEVHHIIPLSSRNEQVEVNPATDLVVVCANCHRMIHRKKNQVLSLEELKKIIKENHRSLM